MGPNPLPDLTHVGLALESCSYLHDDLFVYAVMNSYTEDRFQQEDLVKGCTLTSTRMSSLRITGSIQLLLKTTPTRIQKFSAYWEVPIHLRCDNAEILLFYRVGKIEKLNKRYIKLI